eukprot:TRINITY_DN7658_c0_g1_i1.p2 TRINITY_DN7658_c0_g1~~TRINITY_DN7658_c0_g1_i1.p2  ORF type:complete len:127 (+),score=12.94 TRINITY_DN7658_c0_g1_i1:229-609(+)
MTAPGVDGIHLSELKRLPHPVLALLADWMNAMETDPTAEWPEALTTALLTLIPKSLSRPPLDHRPITVTPVVYRLWGVIRLRHPLPPDWDGDQCEEDACLHHEPRRPTYCPRTACRRIFIHATSLA